MKTLFLTTMMVVFLLICSNGIHAQTVTPNLDQLKLGQGFLGTWQQTVGKDSVEILETQQHGNAFIENVYLVINGKKSLSYINNYCFPSEEGKYKGFVVWTNGGYLTWIGSFVTEKKFSVSFVQNFNPESSFGKMEIVFDTPTTNTVTQFNSEGVKTLEFKSSKVK
jgi:hypothetical protein